MLGGLLMLFVGILYLLFQHSILGNKSGGSAIVAMNNLTKCILGLQVGLIILALIVTRSSVASLQAKRGLPLGNQVVGWTVLSMSIFPI